MPIFEVWKITSSERKSSITAKTYNQAKRIYCKERGIRPSDAWCGLSNISAKKIKD